MLSWYELILIINAKAILFLLILIILHTFYTAH